MRFIQQRQVRMPDSVVHHQVVSFLKTEEEEREQIRKVFKQYDAAKIIADGVVVPNLTLQSATEIKEGYKRFTAEVDMGRKVLTFLTTSNMMYAVDLDKFYMKTNETVFIEQVHLPNIQGTVKAFDSVLDFSMNRYIHAIGVSQTLDPQDYAQGLKPNLDKTLYFMTSPATGASRELEFRQTQAAEGNKIEGLIKSLRDKVSGILPQHVIGANKRVGVDQRLPPKAGTEEGVVALKSIGNGLVAVVYTTGLLKVWSATSSKCIVIHELEQEEKERVKIINAKIQALALPYSAETQSKATQLAIAYGISPIKGADTQWKVLQLQLNFKDLEIETLDRDSQDYIDFSSHTPDSTEIQRISVPCEVTDLIFEKKRTKTHLWLITYDQDEKKNRIKDMMNSDEFVWTFEEQQQYESIFDAMKLPYSLKSQLKSQYQKKIQKHFIKRILAPGRFSFLTMNDLLLRYGASQAEISNENPKVILLRLMQSWDYQMMEEALNFAVETEQLNSQIVGMSPYLSRFPFRLIVRPLGLSIVSPESILTSVVKRYQSLASDIFLYAENSKDQTLAPTLFETEQIQAFNRQILNEGASNPIKAALALMHTIHREPAQWIEKIVLSGQASPLSVIEETLIEANEHEDLLLILKSIVDTHRLSLEKQLNALVICLTQLLFDQNADSVQGFSIQENSGDDKVQYSPLIIGCMTNLLQNQLLALKMLLRDALMLRIWLQRNRPIVSMTESQAESLQIQLENLSFWYQQVLAFTTVSQASLDHRLLKHAGYNKITIMEAIQTSFQQKATFLLYFILSTPRIYNQSQMQIEVDIDLSLYQNQIPQSDFYYPSIDPLQEQPFCFVKNQEALVSNALVYLVKRFFFKQLIRKPTFQPLVLKKLYKLKLYDLIHKYLQSLPEVTSIKLEFIKALIAVVHEQSPSKFIEHMTNCISLYQQATVQGVSLSPTEMILSHKKADEILNFVYGKSHHETAYFYLTLVAQIQDLNERYPLFVLNAALIDQNLSLSEELGGLSDRDQILQLTFNTATVRSSSDTMYYACQQMTNCNKRRELIARFFEQACDNKVQRIFIDKCFFSQEDITFALKHVIDKTMSIISNQEEDNKKIGLNEKKQKLSNLLQVLNIIGVLYQRQDQISRFLWICQQNFQNMVQGKHYQKDFPFLSERQVILLEMQQQVLTLLHCFAEQMGEHLFITDDKDVIEPSRKRKLQEIGQKSDEYKQNHDIVHQRGYSLLRDGETINNRFLQGQLYLLSLADITKQLTLVHSRLACKDYSDSMEPDYLMKILTEIKQYELALHLAQEFDLGIGYPLANYMKSLLKPDEPFQTQYWFNGQVPQLTVQPILQEASTNLTFEIILEPLYRFRVQGLTPLIDLVQNLMALELEIPFSLEQALVTNDMTLSLIQTIYNEETPKSLIAVVDCIIRNLPKSIENLTQCEMSLLIKIYQDMEEFIQANEELMLNQQNECKKCQEFLQQRLERAVQVIGLDPQLIEGLKSISGGDNQNSLLAKAIQESQIDKTIDQAVIDVQNLKSDVNKLEAQLTKFKRGHKEIKEILIKLLNK